MAKTIVLFSTKGGVGKTLITANLAFSFAESKKKVLLIDCDLDVAGNMAWMLNIPQGKALVDIVHLLKKNKEVDINEFITKREANLDFIPAVLKQQHTAYFDPNLIKDIIKLFQTKYDYIIIDGGKAFSESLIRLFDVSNLLLLLATPDVLSIYQTKWALDTLQSLHFPLKMVKIILNRSESLASISMQEIKLVFPCDVVAKIPSEGKIAMLAVNRRVSLIKEFPTSKIAQALNKFAETIIKDEKLLFIEHRAVDSFKMEVEKKENVWDKMGQASDRFREVEKIDDVDEIISLKRNVHQKLLESLQLKKLDLETFSQPEKVQELRSRAESLIAEFIAGVTNSLLGSMETRRKLIKEILDEALGLGPLEDLLKDVEITDIMVNNKEEIYVERLGKIEPTSKRFISNEQVKTIIDRIIAPIGRRIDESSPFVDARLADGSRVNAIIPPLSLTGPTLTIRKFRKERYTSEELIKMNAMTQDMGDFLRACVMTRKNMIVSGGTGSGKTTVLNMISIFIPEGERIITIEDAAELKLAQRHWVRLESRPPNIEGKGSITTRDLFRNTLRMRPDRIIVGECRGAETLDMLQAMNTGHDGSMTTLHASSTRDVLSRLDSMILMSGVELPIRAIREMIAAAIDVIVHTERLSDGTRKVVQITELTGMSDDMHVEFKDIFTFKPTGIGENGKVLGKFTALGYIPSFFDEITLRGITLSKDIFKPTV